MIYLILFIALYYLINKKLINFIKSECKKLSFIRLFVIKHFLV